VTATTATNPRPTATKTHPAGVRPRDPAYRSRSQSRPKEQPPIHQSATNLNARELQTWTILQIVPGLAVSDERTPLTSRPHGEGDLMVGVESVAGRADSQVSRSAGVSSGSGGAKSEIRSGCDSGHKGAVGQGISNPFRLFGAAGGGAR
jgi:hypothetical protein